MKRGCKATSCSLGNWRPNVDAVEKVVQVAVDRDALHRMIDELPEDALAIIVTAPEPERTGWYVFGHSPTFRNIIGLIETAKLRITEQHFENQREGE